MKASRKWRRRDVGQRRAHPRAYLLLGLVFGVLWFGLLGLLYVGGLAAKFVLLSIPTIVGAQFLLRPIGGFERFLVLALLGQEVAAPEPIRYERAAGHRMSGLVNLFRRSYSVFQDGHSWRVLVWTLIRFVTGPLGFLLVVLVPLGRATGGFADLHRRLAVWALGPGRGEIEAAALARAVQAEEQVRIDQELHDSIGHMLSMIVVQAGAGAHVFDKDPDFARRALGTIEQRGRAALGELDRIISTFQGDRAAGIGRHAPLPDGESLPALVAGAREAGMDVVSRIRIGELPPALSRGVYRIVQEALTNAAKHAPGSAVTVDVATGEEAVALSVVNEFRGSRPTARAPGRGLASVRDRATLLGGEASIGTTGQGGFAVAAVLPLAALLPAGASLRCTLAPQCACLGCAIRLRVLG